MRQAALLVAVVCVLAVPAAGAVGAPNAQPSAPLQADSTPAALQDDSAPDRSGVDITVQIRADGSARWTVASKYALDDANDTAAFEQLRGEFEAYQTDSEFSVGVFRAVAPRVSERVGREMAIRDASRSSRLVEEGNNSTGVLSVQFTWTNFSRVEDTGEERQLVVDSFSGGWFGDLSADQTLTIRTPEGYDTDQVQPGPNSITNGAYQWSGPQSFGDGEPRVVFTEAGSPVGVSLVVVGVIVVVALLAGAALVWMYYRGSSLSLPGSGEGTEGESTGTATDTGRPTDGGSSATAAGAGAAAAGATADDEDDEADADAVDPELLSDEERVERLLREHGGRMKQSKIVEETRWSTAKVSQLLSSMAEEGRVEKLRIGRENLISLPGEGVDEE